MSVERKFITSAVTIISDIASLKITLMAGFSIDAGTLIYPVTFTLRDLVHKRLGKSAARTVILLAGGINLFMAARRPNVGTGPGVQPDPVSGVEDRGGQYPG